MTRCSKCNLMSEEVCGIPGLCRDCERKESKVRIEKLEEEARRLRAGISDLRNLSRQRLLKNKSARELKADMELIDKVAAEREGD